MQVHTITHVWSRCFLLEHEGELTLLDTGRPGFYASFEPAFRRIGRRVEDLRHIVLTHTHPDHCGNANALREASGAQVWMSEPAAGMLARGQTFHPYTPRPDPIGWVVEKTVVSRAKRQIDPIGHDHLLRDGECIPVAGGLEVIATPGHSTGQVSLLSPAEGGTLFTGDAAVTMPWLNLPFIAEDWPEAKRSVAALARRDFETAYFAHGLPIKHGASARFRAKWGAQSAG